MNVSCVIIIKNVGDNVTFVSDLSKGVYVERKGKDEKQTLNLPMRGLKKCPYPKYDHISDVKDRI